MTSLVDETLLTHGGKERSVAATKTFTGQMLLFYMLAQSWPKVSAVFVRSDSGTCRSARSNKDRR
jgi:glucosamine 6-phosphate synthetase-like amidotransferase/phosphosugar isomerase protein